MDRQKIRSICIEKNRIFSLICRDNYYTSKQFVVSFLENEMSLMRHWWHIYCLFMYTCIQSMSLYVALEPAHTCFTHHSTCAAGNFKIKDNDNIGLFVWTFQQMCKWHIKSITKFFFWSAPWQEIGHTAYKINHSWT